VPAGGRRKVFLLMAESLFDLAVKGNDIKTKSMKDRVALATCEDRGIKVGKEHNPAKAYTVVDPFVAWVFDEDTDDKIAHDLRPFLDDEGEGGGGGGGGAFAADAEGGKTPAAQINLEEEGQRIATLIRDRDALVAANEAKQKARKERVKELAQKEKEVLTMTTRSSARPPAPPTIFQQAQQRGLTRSHSHAPTLAGRGQHEQGN